MQCRQSSIGLDGDLSPPCRQVVYMRVRYGANGYEGATQDSLVLCPNEPINISICTESRACVMLSWFMVVRAAVYLISAGRLGIGDGSYRTRLHTSAVSWNLKYWGNIIGCVEWLIGFSPVVWRLTNVVTWQHIKDGRFLLAYLYRFCEGEPIRLCII